MAMPVLPGVSDQKDSIDSLVAMASHFNVDFICFGGLTLRPGTQKDTYFTTIQNHYPEHLDGYHRIYRENRPSGAADSRYYKKINDRFHSALLRHDIPGRIPQYLFCKLIPLYTEIAVLLEHNEFKLTIDKKNSKGMAQAGFAIQQWARQQFAKKRNRNFTWKTLEQEFLAIARDKSILDLKGMTPSALPIIEKLLVMSCVK